MWGIFELNGVPCTSDEAVSLFSRQHPVVGMLTYNSSPYLRGNATSFICNIFLAQKQNLRAKDHDLLLR